jgi:cytoskeletal protein CcmA (bactofilin family)
MLSDKKNRKTNISNGEPGANQNRINEGTHIVGDISSKGFFRIDGIVDGTITTPSKVVLGKNGAITGTLTCENADIEGSFKGNLKVTQLLTLRRSAKIEGDVVVGKLSVEPGAVLNATCIMQGAGTSKSNPVVTPYDRSQRGKKKGEEQLKQ